MLGKVVDKVVNTSPTMHEELDLLDMVTYPVKAHVNCLVPPLFYSIIGNVSGAFIVCLDWCGTLWVPHLDQCC
jgi:hypothetical protein